MARQFIVSVAVVSGNGRICFLEELIKYLEISPYKLLFLNWRFKCKFPVMVCKAPIFAPKDLISRVSKKLNFNL